VQSSAYFIQLILFVSFLYYGASCFYSRQLFQEFQRFKLEKWRKVIGGLEVIASLGLFIGFFYPMWTPISSLFLAFTMFIALIVRFKSGDTLQMSAPAIIFFILSFGTFFYSIKDLKFP